MAKIISKSFILKNYYKINLNKNNIIGYYFELSFEIGI